MPTTFVLPELGENIESGTVTAVLVSVGDSVEKDQSVIELETDKAVVEVPSPATGVITEIQAKEGETLNVGDVILVIDDGGAAAAAPAAEKEAEPEVAPEPASEVEEEEAPEPDAEERAPAPESETTAPVVAAPAVAVASPGKRTKKGPVRAAPSVRRFAREIGLDIHEVPPSRPSGRISIDDVKSYAKAERAHRARPAGAGAASPYPTIPLPDFTKWGKVEREAMSNVRMTTARRMAAAWSTIPHVTHHDKADVTALEEFRKQYGARAVAEGAKLTPTAIMVKVLASALKEFPEFNVSLDMEQNEIVKKQYYNIGVAVDTDRGLLVPVIKKVDEKSIIEISVEMGAMAERARNRKTALDELSGACITVTNLGGIGGSGFTPIVNPPEVAILGVSRSAVEPVFKDGEFVPRTMMPLSLSYDHRVVDGANAARFLRWVCVAIEQPFLLLLD